MMWNLSMIVFVCFCIWFFVLGLQAWLVSHMLRSIIYILISFRFKLSRRVSVHWSIIWSGGTALSFVSLCNPFHFLTFSYESIWQINSRKGISVLQLKLYRNCIGDAGALGWFSCMQSCRLFVPICWLCCFIIIYQGFSVRLVLHHWESWYQPVPLQCRRWLADVSRPNMS